MAIMQLVFTDWPRSKGVDPQAGGLQIKSCSEGIAAEDRMALTAIDGGDRNALASEVVVSARYVQLVFVPNGLSRLQGRAHRRVVAFTDFGAQHFHDGSAQQLRLGTCQELGIAGPNADEAALSVELEDDPAGVG